MSLADPTVSEVAQQFGKVGLLIDDAHLAASRTARALYLTDELPKFWVHARTIEAGLRQLKELQQHSAVPRLVVVDRMLPATNHEPPRYWDEAAPADKRAKEFRACIKRLVSQGSTNHKLVLLTSYPPARGEGEFTWAPRSHEPLYRLRTTHRAAALWQCAPEDSVDPKPAAAVRRLSQQLHDDQRFRLLVTGAGMSTTSCTDFPGMPWNDWLLSLAAYETCVEKHRQSADLPPRPAWARQTDAECTTPTLLEPLSAYANEPGLQAMINEFIRTGQVKGGSNFNALFRDELEEDGLEAVFRHHFKRAVLRYDTGVTQRHWLAASLPFDAIVTTNFDGFHQRARAHVLARRHASISAKIAQVISAYGAASENGNTLAFAPREFEERVANVLVRRLRKLAPGRAITVVVVGYAFQDAVLGAALAELAAAPASELLWVVPEAVAVKEGTKAPPTGLQHVSLLTTDRFRPLSMTAVDFFHDLSVEYSRPSAKLW